MPDITLKTLVHFLIYNNYRNNLWHGSHRPHFTNKDIRLEKLSTPGHPGERSDRILN